MKNILDRQVLSCYMSAGVEPFATRMNEIMMEFQRAETNEAAAAAKTTLESNEEISKEDVEIRRLIEERRTTPNEEKQRLKEVSKQKNASGAMTRSKRQEEIQRILEDFKGLRNIPRINLQIKRVLITRIKNEKVEVATSRKGIANLVSEFTEFFSTTKNTKKLNKKMKRIKMKAASMCTAETPMR